MTASHPRCLIRRTNRKLGPGTPLHIARYLADPRVLAVARQILPGAEICSAGVSDRSPEAHLFCHSRIGDLCVDGPAWIELTPVPFGQARRLNFDVAA